MKHRIFRAAAGLLVSPGLALLAAAPAYATDAKSSGDWFDPATWTVGPPGAADGALIKGFSITLTSLGQAAALSNDGFVEVKAADLPSMNTGVLRIGATMIIGVDATGELLLDQGGTAFSRDTLIGYHPNSRGLVTVDGTKKDANGNRSAWTNSGNLLVGSSGFGAAEGKVDLVGGGTIDTYNTAIGNGVSKGFAAVRASTWTNANLFTVGSGGVSGALSVSSGGIVKSLTGVIGYGAGGSNALSHTLGTALLDGGSWINSGDFLVGAYARAELTAINGSKIENAEGYLGYGESGSATARISGSTWRNTASLNVGYRGRATLLIEHGATVSSPIGIVATYGGATGSVTVDDANWIGSRELYVGYGATGPNGSNAEGTLTVRNGGFVSSASAFLGNNEHTLGTATVGGVGPGGRASEWNVNGNLYVGYRGSGELTIEGGGIVKDGLTVLGDRGAGALHLNGGAGARGVLQTAQLSGGVGMGAQVTFDGGVLRATADQAQMLRFIPGVQVSSGGAYIDSNGHRIGSAIPMSGAGGLHKIGGGSFDLRADATFGSLSTVDAGTLFVNGRVDGDVEVGAGATLGGSGRIDGRVTVLPGGTLSPGNSPGTLSVGALVLAPTAALGIELDDAGDHIVVGGNLTLDGRVDFSGDASVLTGGSFSFIAYGGTLVDRGLVIGSLPGGLDPADYTIDLSRPGVLTIAQAVPEPSAGLLMLAGALLLGGRVRQRAAPRASTCQPRCGC